MTVKLPQYRAEIETKMQAVKAMLDAAPNKTSQAYLDAKLNYDMVKGDSGYGLHNMPYAMHCWIIAFRSKASLNNANDVTR